MSRLVRIVRRQKELMALGIEEAMALTLSLNECEWQRCHGRVHPRHLHRSNAMERQQRERQMQLKKRRTLMKRQDMEAQASSIADSELKKASTPPPSNTLPRERAARAAFYARLYKMRGKRDETLNEEPQEKH